ncbi:carboxyl-terminal peptidase [Thalictrum thalictroides]|uniref:Carboxyl-terminal peptidase n=1 Tax=Thalictrum thalictroides TaxID=46969 RepID=A0A7J6V3X3_THATH|nr:carboxyl-terminal peptidase [Thalictrum thalictroides]
MVNPSLYGGDESARAFTMWLGKGGKTIGCYNTNCPGFVYTQNSIVLDQVFDTKHGHTYKGFSVKQDEQGNWWLGVGDAFDPVGYWPKELFSDLWKGADYIEIGGQVYTGENYRKWPQMGTGGEFNPNEKTIASIFQILFINHRYLPIIPGEDGALVEAHQELCYLMKDNSFKAGTLYSFQYNKGYSFQYTGSGGKSNQCRG